MIIKDKFSLSNMNLEVENTNLKIKIGGQIYFLKTTL